MQHLDFQTPVCPRTLARQGAKYFGLIELAQLPRYAAAVESSSPLKANLVFDQDQEGVFIQAHLEATCGLLCQFCLSSYSHALESAHRFRPVLTLEAAREIDDESEPVLYENGFVNIINMLEDDALLAIPNYPRCKACEHENKADTSFAHCYTGTLQF